MSPNPTNFVGYRTGGQTALHQRNLTWSPPAQTFSEEVRPDRTFRIPQSLWNLDASIYFLVSWGAQSSKITGLRCMPTVMGRQITSMLWTKKNLMRARLQKCVRTQFEKKPSPLVHFSYTFGKPPACVRLLWMPPYQRSTDLYLPVCT